MCKLDCELSSGPLRASNTCEAAGRYCSHRLNKHSNQTFRTPTRDGFVCLLRERRGSLRSKSTWTNNCVLWQHFRAKQINHSDVLSPDLFGSGDKEKCS